jgi:predicted enzyme related to lactoylglutathione lyase
MEPDTVTTPSTSWIPDEYTSITPYLCVEGGADAIVFYTTVFGAEVVGRNDGPNGTVAHAEEPERNYLGIFECRTRRPAALKTPR